MPFAGGGAAVWHPWATALSGVAEIVAVRTPGRESRLAEPPFVRLEACVAELMREIAPYSHEDYALCGHSLGALIAFELVRALRRAGLGPPRALIVCAARAPHHPPDLPLLYPMPSLAFLAEVQRRYGAVPAEIRDHAEFLDLLLPVLRADLEMYETYRPRPDVPLAVPTLALGGAHDAIVAPAQVHDWRMHTTGNFESAILAGGHFFPQEDVPATTAHVRAFLERVLDSPAAGANRVAASRGKRSPLHAPSAH